MVMYGHGFEKEKSFQEGLCFVTLRLISIKLRLTTKDYVRWHVGGVAFGLCIILRDDGNSLCLYGSPHGGKNGKNWFEKPMVERPMVERPMFESGWVWMILENLL